MKRKHLLLILMTAMVMAVLTACGSNSTKESGNTDQTTSSEDTSDSQNLDEDSTDSSTGSDNEADSESGETATPDKALVGEWKFSKIVSMIPGLSFRMTGHV